MRERCALPLQSIRPEPQSAEAAQQNNTEVSAPRGQTQPQVWFRLAVEVLGTWHPPLTPKLNAAWMGAVPDKIQKIEDAGPADQRRASGKDAGCNALTVSRRKGQARG